MRSAIYLSFHNYESSSVCIFSQVIFTSVLLQSNDDVFHLRHSVIFLLFLILLEGPKCLVAFSIHISHEKVSKPYFLIAHSHYSSIIQLYLFWILSTFLYFCYILYFIFLLISLLLIKISFCIFILHKKLLRKPSALFLVFLPLYL